MSQSTIIVGGGITGLTAAYYLRQAGADVTILEAGPHLGGKITTTHVAGLPVDVGPDAFLSRSADISALVSELDLDVVAPSSGSYIWSRGKLRPIPPGMAFGLPDRLIPLLRSGLLAPHEVARAGLDFVLPATRTPEDPSIADLVEPRFGNGVYRRLVEPLLGGVHAGDPAQLSARSTAPEVYAIAAGHRSVYASLRKRRAVTPPPSGRRKAPLVSLDGGLSNLTEALVASIGPERISTGTPVMSLSPGWTVETEHDTLHADRLVLAIPAHRAAGLLDINPELAGLLRSIPFVDVANATLAFRRQDLPSLPPGTGFLVPPVEGRFIVGCSWLTNKWPYLANDDTALIKCMVGRAGDRRWLEMTDAQIVEGVRQDLSDMLGVDAEPFETKVQRWPQAMPQYTVGHSARVASIRELAQDFDGLHLAGASYGGSGLAACVTQGRQVAQLITEGALA